MANEYADNVFNLTAAVVCAQNFDGSLSGTPVLLSNGQSLEIEPEAANPQQTGYGRTVALASIVNHYNFSMGQGAIDYSAYQIIAGTTNDEYGTTPDRYTMVGLQTGGGGLPYFSLIGWCAAEGGGGVLVGLPRAKLAAPPTLSITENEFVVPEFEGQSIVNLKSAYSYRAAITRHYETIPAVTLTTDFFNDFFGIV